MLVGNAFGIGSRSSFDAAETTLSLDFMLEHGALQRRRESALAGVDVLDAEMKIKRVDVAAETSRRFIAVLDQQAVRLPVSSTRETVESTSSCAYRKDCGNVKSVGIDAGVVNGARIKGLGSPTGCGARRLLSGNGKSSFASHQPRLAIKSKFLFPENFPFAFYRGPAEAVDGYLTIAGIPVSITIQKVRHGSGHSLLAQSVDAREPTKIGIPSRAVTVRIHRTEAPRC